MASVDEMFTAYMYMGETKMFTCMLEKEITLNWFQIVLKLRVTSFIYVYIGIAVYT